MASARRVKLKVLSTGGSNWLKWVALGVGAAAVVTGGMALAAAPAGLAGAAAITSALAAFGPGGMVGGLLAAGALVSVSTGGLAVGLASPTTSAETVEGVVSAQLAAEILRRRQGLEPDPTIWRNLIETASEPALAHLRGDNSRLDPATTGRRSCRLARPASRGSRRLVHLEWPDPSRVDG